MSCLKSLLIIAGVGVALFFIVKYVNNKQGFRYNTYDNYPMYSLDCRCGRRDCNKCKHKLFHLGDNLGSPIGGMEGVMSGMGGCIGEGICPSTSGNTCGCGDGCIPCIKCSSKDPKHGTCMKSGRPCAVVTKCFPQSFQNKFCELGRLPSGEPYGYCENEHVACSLDRGLRFYN